MVEDGFIAFHSEYHINTNWRNITRDLTNNYYEDMARKGYSKYSMYDGKFYFLREKAGITFIMEYDFARKVMHAYSIESEQKYDYIAVNKACIYVYNTQIITGYRIVDGAAQEVNTFKFGQSQYVECIYICGYFVFFSETLTKNSSRSIKLVNIQNNTQACIWTSDKDDTFFDEGFKRAYWKQWGEDKKIMASPSAAQNISCEFLYANHKRVIAGYTGGKENGTKISYIINIDLEKNNWYVYDTFASGRNGAYPPDNKECVFSFDLTNDVVYVKQEVNFMSQMSGVEVDEMSIDMYPAWKGSNKKFFLPVVSNFVRYYFDGEYAYRLAPNCLYSISAEGEEHKENMHYYPNYDFWCWGDVYVVPVANADNTIVFGGRLRGGLNEDNISRLLDKKIASVETHSLACNTAGNEPVKKSQKNDEDLVDSVVNEMLLLKEQLDKLQKLTLLEFRKLAPQLAGGREELLSFRKSLPQMWDYNAFVGILLGLHARKPGDVASANFAFGQGDNNKSVDRRFDQYGLWDIFNKYKKINDASILLCQVENEIVSIVPEYEIIRDKFNQVLCGLL